MDKLKTYLEGHASFGKIEMNSSLITAYLKEEFSASELNKDLISQGIYLSHLVKRKESLEEQFLTITKKEQI